MTHCSYFAYVASVVLSLSNKSLFPHPESDKEFIPTLSNKQAEWLETSGITHGGIMLKQAIVMVVLFKHKSLLIKDISII